MRVVLWALAALCLLQSSAYASELPVKIGVIKVERPSELPLSRLDIPPPDLGFAGARLSVEDNNTTGRFLKHAYTVEEVTTTPDDAAGAIDTLAEQGVHLFVTLANREDLETLSLHAADRDILILNAQAEDDALRKDVCLPNVLNVAPSRAMKADGLAQFLIWKNWRKWFLIHGSHDEDKLWADALRRAGGKFGAKIVEEREFVDEGGSRRTDTGHVQVQKQIPVFTQRARKHDVVVTADEADVFAAYLPDHTWDARPVAGSAGLRPIGWHAANEAWGATQYQRRFERLANRRVRSLDYQAWLAIRVIGEAVTRTNSASPADVKSYALGDDFELGVFKGTKVTFRPWNQQLRSPILLANDRMIVSVSPQEAFLHKVTRLDTLGFDEAESDCALHK